MARKTKRQYLDSVSPSNGKNRTFLDWYNEKANPTYNINELDQLYENTFRIPSVNGKQIELNQITYNPFYDNLIGDTIYSNSELIKDFDSDKIRNYVNYDVKTPTYDKLPELVTRYSHDANVLDDKYKPKGDIRKTLTKAGRATRANVNTSLIDSIAYNAGKENADLAIALGHAIKESTLGGGIEHADSPTEIYQNWSFYRENPYESDMRQIDRAVAGKYNIEEPYKSYNQNANRSVLAYHAAKERLAKTNAQSLKKPYSGPTDISPIRHAIRKYKTNPNSYNPGQGENYHKLVRENARDIMRSPEIMSILKTSGYRWYERGRKESK